MFFLFLTCSATLLREVVDGLRIYFDFTLPTLLLYNFERDQYRTAMKIAHTNDSLLSEQYPALTVTGQEPGIADEDRNGFVSSSTEPVSSTSKMNTITTPQQNDSSENSEESKFSDRPTLFSYTTLDIAIGSCTAVTTCSFPRKILILHILSFTKGITNPLL